MKLFTLILFVLGFKFWFILFLLVMAGIYLLVGLQEIKFLYGFLLIFISAETRKAWKENKRKNAIIFIGILYLILGMFFLFW